MGRLAAKLADYILDKGAIGKEDYEIYQYGFQTGLEMLSCLIVTLLLSLKLKMFGEYIVFFSIFILLRSYAGGLHLNRFLSCFVCSCFVEIATLLFAKNYQFPSKISFFIILGMTFMVKVIKPIDHENRPISDGERLIFKKCLNTILIVIILLDIFIYYIRQNYYLSLMAITIIVVVISMIIGKWKNFKNGDIIG